ncbi:F-box/LRR-repeat protein At4g29420 [Aristolochia californica]|uniref:F-box/LRR-repeat protein At4g29420 n=1 Tax=Aristolochia californica TaxID=171875 RepID=UPI0035E16A55
MEELPQPLLLEILSRLHDAADLARCRVASKTLNSLSLDVRALTILCFFDRFLKSRSPRPQTTTPFKSIVTSLIFRSRSVESISIGVENPVAGVDDDKEAEADDLWLTSVDFVSEWLPNIGSRLTSLSISDFWTQSCWRSSVVLPLISKLCDNLLSLEVKNAWLSVEGLQPMPKLTSLTLEFIRLDDEYLTKVTECFFSLRVLKLIGVGGLREPRIHLLQLRTCHWTVSNAPTSLFIHAPNLIELKLQCVQPKSLVIKSPLLSVFDLSIEKSFHFIDVEEFLNLKTLRIYTSDFHDLVKLLPWGKAVESLVLEAPKWDEMNFWELVSIEMLTLVFPYLKCLVLGPWVWFELESCFEAGGPSICHTHGWLNLKRLRIQLAIENVDLTYSFLSFILNLSPMVSDVEAIVHWKVEDFFQHSFKLKCEKDYPRIKWSWNEWK